MDKYIYILYSEHPEICIEYATYSKECAGQWLAASCKGSRKEYRKVPLVEPGDIIKPTTECFNPMDSPFLRREYKDGSKEEAEAIKMEQDKIKVAFRMPPNCS